MYDLIAWPLEQFYGLWPNYAGAIALLTLAIMILLLPLTLKGTRSMLAMQKLQPELKKLQNKHRDDRQKLNEEVMKFYKENNINPLSGCLPLLLQMPVFFLLYQTLFQLLNRAPFGQDMGAASARAVTQSGDAAVFADFGVFYPRHIEPGSALYTDLNSANEMRSFGINLAESTQQAFSSGFGHAWPFLILVLAVTATSYYQQRQIAGRNTGTPMNPQQAMLLKILPLFFAFISFTLPAGIVVYFLVSNVFRIGQQAFITRTMYRDDSGPVETTGKAVDKTSANKPKKGMLAQLRESAEAGAAAKGGRAGGSSSKGSGASSSKGASGGTTRTATATPTSGKASGPSRKAPSNANRSRNKKKRK